MKILKSKDELAETPFNHVISADVAESFHQGVLCNLPGMLLYKHNNQLSRVKQSVNK